MTIKKYIILFAAIYFISLAGCSDAPTPIGANILKQDNIGVLNFNSLTDSVYQTSSYLKQVETLSSSTTLLLGKYSNVEASILVRFFYPLPDTTVSDLRNNKLTVTSASIVFTRNYLAGDSTAAFDFQAFKINSNWYSTFDADSLSTLNYDPTDISSNRQLTDSLCSFNVDNQLVASWLLSAADSSFDNGILIKPTTNTNKVIGLTALSAYATLPIPELIVVVAKPGVYSNDSLIFIPLTDLSVVDGSRPQYNSELFYMEGAVTLTGKLAFDISKIPAHSVINSATLTLAYDSLSSTGPFPSIIYAYNLKDSTTNVLQDSTIAGSLYKGNGTYSGNITPLVSDWVNGNNQGILLYPINRISTVSLLALKSSTAVDRNLRPKLQVVYTLIK